MNKTKLNTSVECDNIVNNGIAANSIIRSDANKKLTSVALSGNANEFLNGTGAFSAAGSGGGLASGMIVAYTDSVTPSGFLPCNGQTYNTADYPTVGAQLANKTISTITQTNVTLPSAPLSGRHSVCHNGSVTVYTVGSLSGNTIYYNSNIANLSTWTGVTLGTVNSQFWSGVIYGENASGTKYWVVYDSESTSNPSNAYQVCTVSNASDNLPVNTSWTLRFNSNMGLPSTTIGPMMFYNQVTKLFYWISTSAIYYTNNPLSGNWTNSNRTMSGVTSLKRSIACNSFNGDMLYLTGSGDISWYLKADLSSITKTTINVTGDTYNYFDTVCFVDWLNTFFIVSVYGYGYTCYTSDGVTYKKGPIIFPSTSMYQQLKYNNMLFITQFNNNKLTYTTDPTTSAGTEYTYTSPAGVNNGFVNGNSIYLLSSSNTTFIRLQLGSTTTQTTFQTKNLGSVFPGLNWIMKT